MGQNGSTNCCGTTECQSTEVEVSEYQLSQNQILKRPAQVSSGGVLTDQQQKQLEEQQKLLLQQQQINSNGQHLGSTQQLLPNGNEKGSTLKKKNMQNHELANHLRKISNNDRIIMENSIIHSSTKRINEVTSAKKIKKELAEIVHFAKVLQLKIISSSTLSKGSVIYINAQGLENSLRKELDGVTFFGCKKRCRNIDNLGQGQIDNFSSYSSSSSNEDELEEDDHTFDQAVSNQILNDIYDDQDIPQQNKQQQQQNQQQGQQQQQYKSYSFPKGGSGEQTQQRSGLNSKSNFKSSATNQQKSQNQRVSQKPKIQADIDNSFDREEEKENNPHQINSKQNYRTSAPLTKKSTSINPFSNKSSNDGLKKNPLNKQQIQQQQPSYPKKEEGKFSFKPSTTTNQQQKKGNVNPNPENLKSSKNFFIQDDKKSNKINKNGDIVNDFVIPSPDPEISKRHRGRHFQIKYDRQLNSYRIKDLGIGFGCFYKLDGPLLLKDNHLLNIGLIFVVINFTINQDNTVLDASTINKSSNTTQQQHPTNISQLRNNQSLLQSQNISNIRNGQNNNHNQLQQNNFTSLNQSVDFVNESINKICIRLKFFGGPCNGEQCLLDPQKETFATIGRNKEQCTLHFDDHLLSKIQCRIVFKPNEGWYLIDGSQKRPSTNGTWLYLAEEQEIYDGMIFKANQTLLQCTLQ